MTDRERIVEVIAARLDDLNQRSSTMPDVPDREWFIHVDSVCSLVGHRRYGLADDDLADQLKQISLDARRFADEVGDRYVGGFPITAEAMKAMLEKNGYTVIGGDS